MDDNTGFISDLPLLKGMKGGGKDHGITGKFNISVQLIRIGIMLEDSLLGISEEKELTIKRDGGIIYIYAEHITLNCVLN